MFENVDIDNKVKLICLCIDEYSKKVDNRFELELDKPIIITQYGKNDSSIKKIVKFKDQYGISYCAEVIRSNSFITYIGISYLSSGTINKIYNQLIKKYPEIVEADNMGFFDLKKI